MSEWCALADKHIIPALQGFSNVNTNRTPERLRRGQLTVFSKLRFWCNTWNMICMSNVFFSSYSSLFLLPLSSLFPSFVLVVFFLPLSSSFILFLCLLLSSSFVFNVFFLPLSSSFVFYVCLLNPFVFFLCLLCLLNPFVFLCLLRLLNPFVFFLCLLYLLPFSSSFVFNVFLIPLSSSFVFFLPFSSSSLPLIKYYCEVIGQYKHIYQWELTMTHTHTNYSNWYFFFLQLYTDRGLIQIQRREASWGKSMKSSSDMAEVKISGRGQFKHSSIDLYNSRWT